MTKRERGLGVLGAVRFLKHLSYYLAVGVGNLSVIFGLITFA